MNSVSDKGQDRRQFICGREKCNKRRLSVLDIVDAAHARAKNGGFVEIRSRSNKAKGQRLHEALRLGCEYLLKIPKTKQQLVK